jgi:NAD(P)-dependent dehydrogenase (short-subunit alcohol dehydrogenase family)
MAFDFFTLKDKIILISGASSGIGQACARRCADAGATVVLLARNKERLQSTRDSLFQSDKHITISADLMNDELPEKRLNEITENLGKISGFIHAAGISSTLPLRMVTEHQLSEMYKVNVLSAVSLTKWMSKPSHFHESGCSVVWIASIMGMVGEVAKISYSLTKGALIGGAKSLALELAPKKIRVNTVSPGVVSSPMTENAVYNQTDHGRERIQALHPLGLGTVNDVANACHFLVSDESRWITGTNLVIDGGYTAR